MTPSTSQAQEVLGPPIIHGDARLVAQVSIMADETKAANPALDGLGCRPSPSFIALALNRVGFRYVYGASSS